VQRAAAARLSQALVPDGWLAVSPAEASAELLNPLVPVNFPGAIFYRKEEAVPVVPQPPARADGPEGEAAGWGREAADLRGAVLDPSFAASTAAGEDVADPAPLLERARLLADQGHLEEARRLWDAALAKDRLNPRAYLLLAAIQQEQGEISDALDALRRAIYLAPDAVMPHFLRGCLLLRQGRRGLGMQCLKTAMHLLSRLPREAVVPDGDGLTAGHLMELAQEYAAIGPVRGDRPRGIHAGQP
jgi:chemotaxis protein methyltransferase CheR